VNKFNPQKSSVVRTYDEPRAAETEGAGLHYRGKALEYTATALLIVGIVALGAAAEAQNSNSKRSGRWWSSSPRSRAVTQTISVDLSVTRTERKGVSLFLYLLVAL
jgi:hypothetical protein